MSTLGDGDGQGGGEKKGEYVFFMVFFRVDSLASAERRWSGLELGTQGSDGTGGASVSG